MEPYDALSRLTTLLTVRRDGLPVDSNATQPGNQPEATRYHFDLLGRPDYTELPNGVVEDYVFDNMDRLDLMQHFQSDSNNADLTDNALKNMFDCGRAPELAIALRQWLSSKLEKFI